MYLHPCIVISSLWFCWCRNCSVRGPRATSSLWTTEYTSCTSPTLTWRESEHSSCTLGSQSWDVPISPLVTSSPTKAEGGVGGVRVRVFCGCLSSCTFIGDPPRLLVVQREAALLKGEKADLEGRLSTVQSKM